MKSLIALLATAGMLSIAVAANAQQKSAVPANDGWKISNSSSSSALQADFDRPCVDGMAGEFTCQNVDLLAFMPIDSIGGRRIDGNLVTSLNDIWGWTDPETGREYALVGRNDGTSFVDVTDPISPTYLGDLPKTAGSVSNIWRDVKVYRDHAFIVADNAGQHGVQIFDLTQLRSVGDAPAVFSETAHYDGIHSAHNIVINTETGFAYTVGNSGGGGETCGGGFHMINIQDPTNPTFAGCYAVPGTGRVGGGYTHDAQCVLYHGPDSRYSGREICVGANETHVVFVDVTDKANPTTISKVQYPAVSYAHQGWFTPDHRYFLQDDELDERNANVDIQNTRTLIWDVADLSDPQLADIYSASTRSIDHNQYTVQDRVLQSNYTSGLRILDISDPENAVEVGFFDSYPANDNASFDGSWSNYPYFASGNVVLTGIGEGLFVVRPTGMADVGAEPEEVPTGFHLLPAYPNPFNPRTTVAVLVDQSQQLRVAVFDARGKEVVELYSGHVAEPRRVEFVLDGEDLASGTYFIRAFGASGSQTTAVTLQK